MKKIYNFRKNQVSFWKSLVAITVLLSCQNSIGQFFIQVPNANPNVTQSNFPLGSYYGYQRIAMIYEASELFVMTPGVSIKKISFFYNSFQNPNGNAPFNIRMSNTTQNLFSTDTFANVISDTQEVFNGTGTFIPAGSPSSGWFTIDLDTPFEYTGGKLKITVATNAGGTGNETQNAKNFRFSGGSSEVWQQDNTAPTGLGTIYNTKPNIRLDYTEVPINDSCFGAKVPNSFPYVNDQLLGQNATNNEGFLGCTDQMNDGVWYAFAGVNTNLNVDISNVDPTFDPQVNIYTGDCNNLTCVASTDIGFAGAGESLTFFADDNLYYFVNVGHYSGINNLPEGNFRIKIRDAAPNVIKFENQLFNIGYENNQSIIPIERSEGTIGAVSVDYAPNDGTAYGNIDYGSAIGTLTWADGDFAPKNIIVQMLPDAIIDPLETFTIILSNPINATIDSFDITNSGLVTIIDSNAVPANDACAGAIAAVTLPYSHIQTLGESATNNAGFIACGLGGINDGLWYKFTGNGSDITVAISDIVIPSIIDLTFNPQIDIYSGTCNTLTCINTIDDFYEGENETLTIPSTLGTVYYINVGGYRGDRDLPEGNFKIDITTTALANESFDFKNLKVYPNPVTNILNIENAQKITKITIINMLGQELITKNFDDFKTEVDFSELQTGNYFAKVYSNNSVQTIKIIKK